METSRAANDDPGDDNQQQDYEGGCINPGLVPELSFVARTCFLTRSFVQSTRACDFLKRARCRIDDRMYISIRHRG